MNTPLAQIPSPTMSLKPYTREMLTLLKANTNAILYAKKVDDEVKRIYTLVLDYAKVATMPFFTVEIPVESYDIVHDVIYELNVVFPDCTFLRKVLTRGVDGSMYDSALSVDQNGIRLQKKQFHKLYITVDWS
jgi:hypothetical protein